MSKSKKKKKKENINEIFDHMKTVKDSLKNIIKPIKFSDNRSLHNILQDTVYRTNKIIIHTYNFIKAYVLYLCQNEKDSPLPIIDRQFVKIIMRIVSKRKDKRGAKPDQKYLEITSKLIEFYKNYFKRTLVESDKVYDDKLSFVLPYECDKIVTCIEINIKKHFIDHVKRLINIQFNLKEKISKINNDKNLTPDDKKKLRSETYEDIRNIKNDILDTENKKLSSDRKYHKWIRKNKYSIIPKKESYGENSIYYDVCCSPQDYLKGMIYINQMLEEHSAKLFNALPLKTRIIPGYITIETSAVAAILMETDPKKYRSKIKAKKMKIWNQAFDINKKVFKKKGYIFNGSIQTDGVGCSILFVKTDSKGNPIKMSSAELKAMKTKKNSLNDRYIEDQPDIKKILENKNYVCIDPNLSDLMYCMDKNGNKFRYTQNQRRSETRRKKYSEIIQNINSSVTIDENIFRKKKIIEEKRTVQQIESDLTKDNLDSKTCNFVLFLDYVKIKNRVNRCLFDQYQNELYRKLKWNSFINTQKSESKMLRNFKEKFGPPGETTVIIGDYDKISHPKGKEPCLTKGLRKVLRNFGYNLFLINEFRTSKLCNRCHVDVENFHWIQSKRAWNEGADVMVWGLVRCKNDKCRLVTPDKTSFSYSIHNRDQNAARNMLCIVNELIETGKRPLVFTRPIVA